MRGAAGFKLPCKGTAVSESARKIAESAEMKRKVVFLLCEAADVFFPRAMRRRRSSGKKAQPPPMIKDCTRLEDELEWRELLAADEAGGADPARLRSALERGVPPPARASVWLGFSGAAERMSSHPRLYEQLVGGDESAANGCSDTVIDQIEKDLRRTDVGAEGEPIDGEGVAPLRRVLCAFARYNPAVSYVQGMNFIAWGLLSVVSEEGAFWMLVLIVQMWLPEHFSHDMVRRLQIAAASNVCARPTVLSSPKRPRCRWATTWTRACLVGSSRMRSPRSARASARSTSHARWRRSKHP